MLVKPLLNCEDYLYCGTLELNNVHQSFAKLHRLLIWNSKQCSSKLRISCIHFYCGSQELNDAHYSFAKLDTLLLWNSSIKQCASKHYKLHRLRLWNSWIKQSSSKFCLNCIEFNCGTQELNNAHQSFA